MSENARETILRPDLCVIGAGSGGLSLAAAAAALGVPVVLVEKGAMGGDCLNVGCVPSKALIAAGAAAQALRDGAPFGVAAESPRVDFAAVRAHVRSVIDEVAPKDSAARFAALGVRVIAAAGKFVSPRALEADGLRIEARRFVIATGSSPAVPPIPGLDQVRYLTNESIFDLDERPERLVIVGGGAVGLELAQAFRRLGVETVVIEAERLLAKEDRELVDVALDRLRAEGVELREGARVESVSQQASGVRVMVSDAQGGPSQIVEGTHLLIAAGRAPNVHNLGLEQAGVRFDKQGVVVNAGLRTSNRRIYAIGDVAGGGFTHAANHHAGLVLRATLFRARARLRAERIPRVVYTDPEIAVTGLNEAQARAQHKHVRVYRAAFADNDRAVAGHAARGHIKIIADHKNRILGAGVVGAHAGELLAPWQLALAKGMTTTDMADLVLPYPTLSEISRAAALGSYQAIARAPWLRRLLRLLRKFG